MSLLLIIIYIIGGLNEVKAKDMARITILVDPALKKAISIAIARKNVKPQDGLRQMLSTGFTKFKKGVNDGV